MRTRDIPFSDWRVVTDVTGGVDTAHPTDVRMRLQGILFRGTGDFVAIPAANPPEDNTTKTLPIEADNEFHPLDVRTIDATTTSLPLVLFYGWNR